MRPFLLAAALAACALVAPGLAQAASPDGTGALDWLGDPVGNPSTGNFVPFTFSLASGESFQEGELLITVPSGWSPPSTNPGDEGYTTSDCGFVETGTLGAQTIWIQGMNLVGPASCQVLYGDLPGPGVSVPPTSPGGAVFSTQTKGMLGGGSTFQPIATSPKVWVTSADGSGTMTTPTQTVPNGSTANTINFTYTAAFGGIFGGVVTLTVPPGWSQPDDSNPAAEGFTTADIPGGCGCPPIVFVDGRTIFVFPLFLGIPTDPETTLDITYGDTSGGGPGATAPTTAGRQHWPTKEASNCGCSSVLRRLASAPAITVLSQDGSGTMKASASTVSANSRNTIKFKYAAAPGGMDNGTVTLDVATDWSSPSTNPTADGYVTASAGTVSTAGQTITVSNLTLFGSSVTITYGSKAGGGAGALAPATTGAHTWFARQRSSAGVTPPTPLFTSPQITVFAADGSGTLTTPTTDVSDSSTGNTIEFTYIADAGGIQNGVVVLTVPPGWSAPSTSSAADGYTTSSAGNVAVSGRKITVSGLTLGGGGTFVLTYGASSGATAPATVGPQTWTTKERSTNTGVLTPLTAGSPVITVN